MALMPDKGNPPSPLKAWVRALERTAAIERDHSLTLPVVIERLAARQPDAPALLGSDSALSYAALAAACNRYGRWALARGLAAGDVVCLLMGNCPDYMAIWLGLSRIGVTVALVNTSLRGELLAHSINAVAPRFVITDAALSGAVREVRARLVSGVEHWAQRTGRARPAETRPRDRIPAGRSAHRRALPAGRTRGSGAVHLYLGHHRAPQSGQCQPCAPHAVEPLVRRSDRRAAGRSHV